MYDKDIECKIICPKCGQERVFNDREYVDTLQDWELPIICTKCHNRFVIHRRDVETFYKTAHGDIRIDESRKLKEKIISLMERIEGKGKYNDSKFWGWNYLVNNVYSKSNLTPEELESLHKSYDKYALEAAAKGEMPNDTGFDMWCMDRELKAQKRGIKNLFPNY